ncbi:MAG: ATP-binding protein [Clostridia bacterium]|nr:ATP-binding protein [Clostridia bacterium]
MTKRIFRSILLVSAAVLIASILIIMSAFYTYFSETQQQRLNAQTTLVARGIENEGASFIDGLDLDEYRFTWIDGDGTVLFDSKADAAEMDNHADREEVAEALVSGVGDSSRTSATLAEKTLYRAKRLADGTVVRVSITQHTILTLTMGMLQPMLIVLLVAIVLSVLLAHRLSKRVMQPLNELNLDKPLENELYSELSPLLNRIESQRVRIEQQRREVEQRREEFEQITRSMREGMVLLNEKGRILSINPAAMELFNTEKDCIGNDLLTIDRSSQMHEAFQAALNRGHFEFVTERGNREYRIELDRVDADLNAAGIVMLIFDITEKALAEKQRREFTANVSHELKTPIQSIMGSAELMENGLVRPEDMPNFIGRIRAEAKRLVNLIDDIIGLSRLDEGGEFEKEPVDLLSTAKEAAYDLSKAAEKAEVTLKVQGESAIISGSKRLVYEIVYNLTDNAIRYNRTGGSVDISVKSDDTGSYLIVSDSGIGIAKEHQERVFERFYRVDKSHSKETGGTGLGLSIVKHAAKILNADLTLESQQNQGTTITVRF